MARAQQQEHASLFNLAYMHSPPPPARNFLFCSLLVFARQQLPLLLRFKTDMIASGRHSLPPTALTCVEGDGWHGVGVIVGHLQRTVPLALVPAEQQLDAGTAGRARTACTA